MPRGDKSGNPKMKRHRAARIAARMMEQGAPRAEANRIATAAMDREYAGVGRNSDSIKVAVDEEAHDSRSGQRKTNLTTKQPSVSGARKPNAAQRPATTKRSSGKTGQGKAAVARKPRVAATPGARADSHHSAAATRQSLPRKSAGYGPSAANKKAKPNRSKAVEHGSMRTSRAQGVGDVRWPRESAMAGRQSAAKKSSGVFRSS